MLKKIATIFLAILIFIAGAGIYMNRTNPTKADFIEYLQNEENIKVDENTASLITRKNYWACSIFEYEPMKDEQRFLGINNHFQWVGPRE